MEKYLGVLFDRKLSFRHPIGSSGAGESDDWTDVQGALSTSQGP